MVMERRGMKPILAGALIVLAVFLIPAQGAALTNVLSAGSAVQALADQASHVVIGEVEGVESRRCGEGGVIFSFARIAVEEYLKGDYRGDEIVVRCLGGEVDGMGLMVSTEPSFSDGERVKLLLMLEETGEFTVVGGKRGKVSLHGGGAAASAGYDLTGYRWSPDDLPVEYYINELGTPDTEGEFVAVQLSFQAWEDVPGSYMDYTYMGTTDREASALLPLSDGYNVVCWGFIDGIGGRLAQCLVWYDTDTKLILESDIVFDDAEEWSTTGEPDRYDVQNVGTHEVGHSLGLGDLYDPADSEETMYAYCMPGETDKRTLEAGDKAGLRALYPGPMVTYTISTEPPGLLIEVDGELYDAPQSFSWYPDSAHTIGVPSPQSEDAGTRYVYTGWSDGGEQSHAITVGTSDASITAYFKTQRQISIAFRASDGEVLHPTRIEILGAPPNGTAVAITSYSNVWLDDVEWTARQILWQGNNAV
ncbi:TPA: matrixin family metalloprotease, partial [Candidatus Bathyarchaeota archaeon]|nr:matrixin family metalloprotease [Candidatus Bathyarchaeota archaeon]